MLAILDPSLVVPHVGQEEKSARAALAAIVEISAAVREGRLDLVSSDSLYEVLAELDLFPLRQLYDEVLSSLKLDQAISGSDVATLVLGILDRSVPLESVVADFEVESSASREISGLASPCSCHARLELASAAALHLAAACAVIDPLWDADFFASHRGEGASVRLELTFSTILASDGTLVEAATYVREVPTAAGVEAAIPVVDPVRILRRCRRSRDAIRAAIDIELRQRDPRFQGPEWRLHSWLIDDFASPVLLNNESLVRRALRACVDVITDSCPRDSHALRVGPGASDDQVVRSGCKAWRQDVDREWHLHFWRCSAGRLQLATLRGHAYFGIPDPEP